MGIRDLNAEIEHCTRCRLSATRTHAVCGEGNLSAELMLVAQAPGEKEDKAGTMFIGPSGQVLDMLLERAQIDRKHIYMTNLIKCMLPKYRRPKQDEINTCSQYLDSEIELIGAKTLVPLGYFATRYVLGKFGLKLPPKAEFHNLYGKLLGAENKQFLPLQHPASLLYDASIQDVLIRNYQKMRPLLYPRAIERDSGATL